MSTPDDPAGDPVVDLTSDRRHLIVTWSDGRRTTHTSARPGGFTAWEVNTITGTPPRMEPGQTNRARQVRVGPVTVTVHLNTGPPTWRVPRVRVRRGTDGAVELSAGWWQALAAVAVNVYHDNRS